MSTQPTLYKVEPNVEDASISLHQVWIQDGRTPLAANIRHILTAEVDGRSVLMSVAADSRQVRCFEILGDAPWFLEVESAIDLTGPVDIVRPFVLGNNTHLLVYNAERGTVQVFPLVDGLTTPAFYEYPRARPPGETSQFDVVQPMEINGAVFYLCYSSTTGMVNIYSLEVTASSTVEGQPALRSRPIWTHAWARRWTRFAFFRLGSGTYFVKTNEGRLNVNIDHVQDDPTDGTIEIATHLELADALALTICEPFKLHGFPYFATYRPDGLVAVNRIHGDGRGWDTMGSVHVASGADHLVPIEAGGASYFLFC